MSIKWFRACDTVPARPEKCLVSLKGVYYLAQYDASAGVFCVEAEDAELQIPSADPDLYWATLHVSESPLSILVVDDDPDDVEELVSTVRYINASITINAAYSGTQALSFLSSLGDGYPDIILLDLYMPEADGFSVLQTVRSKPELSHTKVYVLSNSVARNDWERARELGATAIFHKNHAKIELARVLTQVRTPDADEKKA